MTASSGLAVVGWSEFPPASGQFCTKFFGTGSQGLLVNGVAGCSRSVSVSW